MSRAVRTIVSLLVALTSCLVGFAATSPPAAASGSVDGRIAFVRDQQVFSMNAWGRDVRQLTWGWTSSHPEWSPDGRRIAFIRQVGTRRDVWVMSSNGRNQRPVTRTGDVTSEGATWSPDGRTLAYAAAGELTMIRSTYPHGVPARVLATPVGGFCDDGTTPPEPVAVDRFAAWSPDGATIAVLNHSDCFYEDSIDHYDIASGELRHVDGSGAECCGYQEWSDLFWGPGGQFGFSELDPGYFDGESGHPLWVVYPGLAPVAGDTSASPSPSGAQVALANAGSGQSLIVRADLATGRRTVLAAGEQPDWQRRPR